MAKTTSVAKIEVAAFTAVTMTASLKQLLLRELYDENEMTPPNPSPSEKKICVAAAVQTSWFFMRLHCGVRGVGVVAKGLKSRHVETGGVFCESFIESPRNRKQLF